jgi:hypothetical protein
MNRYLLLLLFGLLFISCSGAERTTGQVLGNAGDAIRVGEKKIWYPSTGASSSAPSKERKQE